MPVACPASGGSKLRGARWLRSSVSGKNRHVPIDVDDQMTESFGRGGLRVSRVGYGAAALGNLYAALDEGTWRGCVPAAWEAGVRYFDTAPHYGLGLSERRLGESLAAFPRDEYVLSTKVGRILEPNDAFSGQRDDNIFEVSATHRRVRDHSAEGVRRSIEESLERLGLDRIDIAYVHD